MGTSRLRLVVTFYFCWRGCRSYLVFVAQRSMACNVLGSNKPRVHVVYVYFLFVCFYVCCASPGWCVASFVRSSLLCCFCVPPLCPFIPFCSSVAVMTLRRYGHAPTGIPFIPYVCGGGHRHSFGVTSCWFSLPPRFSLCFSWRRIVALHGM